MKRIAFLLAALLCSAAAAQDLPKIAVYVTGDVSENEKRALGTRMLATLINSGRYIGIERSSGFIAEIEKEQERQRSGAIDDSQISELGRQFGVTYVCIADITPAFGSYQVSARIVDVETAVVVFIGDAHSPLKTMNDLADVSEKVVRAMFGKSAEPRPKPAKTPEPKPAAAQTAQAAPPRQTPAQRAAQEPGRAPEIAAIPVKPEPMTPKPNLGAEPKISAKPSFWIALGAEAAAVGILAYGILEDGRVASYVETGDLREAETPARNRNAAYAIGAAVLLSGISIHIFF
jgi:hypothetical protein